MSKVHIGVIRWMYMLCWKYVEEKARSTCWKYMVGDLCYVGSMLGVDVEETYTYTLRECVIYICIYYMYIPWYIYISTESMLEVNVDDESWCGK